MTFLQYCPLYPVPEHLPDNGFPSRAAPVISAVCPSQRDVSGVMALKSSDNIWVIKGDKRLCRSLNGFQLETGLKAPHVSIVGKTQPQNSDLVWALSIYLFLFLTCYFFSVIHSESKFGYEAELVRVFLFVSILCLIFFQIKGINFIFESIIGKSCTHQLCKESCYKRPDCTP